MACSGCMSGGVLARICTLISSFGMCFGSDGWVMGLRKFARCIYLLMGPGRWRVWIVRVLESRESDD